MVYEPGSPSLPPVETADRLTLQLQPAMTVDPNTPPRRTRDALVKQGFLPIMIDDDWPSEALVDGAVAAGCRAIEVSSRRHDARQIVPWIKANHPGVRVFGATLTDWPRLAAHLQATLPHTVSVEEMADLGVDGLVSRLPFRPQTYERYGHSLLIIPGVTNAEHALQQIELGAILVKIVVGFSDGEVVAERSFKALDKCLPYFVTGGMVPERIDSFIKQQALVTAGGFDLIFRGHEPDHNASLADHTRDRITAYLNAVREARRRHQPELLAALDTNQPDPLAAGLWLR